MADLAPDLNPLDVGERAGDEGGAAAPSGTRPGPCPASSVGVENVRGARPAMIVRRPEHPSTGKKGQPQTGTPVFTPGDPDVPVTISAGNPAKLVVNGVPSDETAIPALDCSRA